MKKKLIFFLLLASISTISSACPFCNTQTAAEIRASLFGPDFFYYLMASLLPFLIFVIIILLIYKGGYKTKTSQKIKL
jgi:hypothetical protein